MLSLAKELINCDALYNGVSKIFPCHYFLTITPRLFYSTRFAGSLFALQLILSICLIQTGVQKKLKRRQGRTRLAFVFSRHSNNQRAQRLFCVRARVIQFSAQGELSLMRSQDVSLERDGAECQRVRRVPR